MGDVMLQSGDYYHFIQAHLEFRNYRKICIIEIMWLFQRSHSLRSYMLWKAYFGPFRDTSHAVPVSVIQKKHQHVGVSSRRYREKIPNFDQQKVHRKFQILETNVSPNWAAKLGSLAV
ncbi:hypothetical protein NE237_000260 [Protea cynaroides]|uniref:Uncharacterized protein n=1 Tax=Protea cynaroides TaxID=273540 RepID=A0A9Q0KR76_9MAGN|nr:hypothetical protein NE237_000260 [Protea cynaroides]